MKMLVLCQCMSSIARFLTKLPKSCSHSRFASSNPDSIYMRSIVKVIEKTSSSKLRTSSSSLQHSPAHLKTERNQEKYLIRDNENISVTQNFRTNLNKSSFGKDNKTKLKADGPFTVDEAPSWFLKLHLYLMKTVNFPKAISNHKDYSLSKLQSLTTTELISIARGTKILTEGTHNLVIALWRRMDQLTVEQMLTVADIYYLNGSPSRIYYSALLTYISEMFDQLQFTPLQLARLMFHISVHRTAPPTLLLDIEGLMLKKFSLFNLNLITITCHLFFTSHNRLQSFLLLDKLAGKLLEDINSIDLWCLPLVMKMLRYSSYINHGFYKHLADRLVEFEILKKFRSVAHVMHFAFTYASVHVSHPELFTQILSLCDSMQEKARMKDVSKIIWASSTLVTNSPNQIKSIHSIVDYALRTFTLHSVQKYPDNLVEFLMGLALLNIYPTHLYDLLFHPTTVKSLLGLSSDREKWMQLHFFYCSLLIECPEYLGNQLSAENKKFIEDKLTFIHLEADRQAIKSLQPALEALRNSLGESLVHGLVVLPHFRTTDIVVIYDKEKKCFLNPLKSFLPKSVDDFKNIHTDNVDRVVIQLLNKSQTIGDNKPLGMLYCKTRQLTTLGYKVISVDAEEANMYLLNDLKINQVLLLSHLSETLGDPLC